jgi:hypothetical protein
LGIKGSMGVSDWQYDLSGNHGQTINTSISPSINFQNFTNALNAVAGPGGIICAPGYTTSPLPTQSGCCAPFNPFGNGIASPAAYAYVTDLASAVSTLTQRVFTASVAGSAGSLPVGRIKLTAGYENRRESADFEPDQFYQQGLGYSTPIAPTQGSFLTNEIFGEALLPIVSPAMAIPGLRQLELETAAREVNHSVAGGARPGRPERAWHLSACCSFAGIILGRYGRLPSSKRSRRPPRVPRAGLILVTRRKSIAARILQAGPGIARRPGSRSPSVPTS